ncbi:hypothetical protein Wcon_01045 [Wolbachia endosymbiont of Cylisticus convexus]|uniref:hypothetical protein n=1 Tax=Wolbachia endosymbiont of Cylisticus convexus TaxID=118728 RepID=UPI000E16C93B|nr:hypothetical protein [Wolbachia endosymbiont of Cylisticus convexus]RDD34847.1 hypothetical protein Wcon_01045 [Wolbachia endosymbiont of Cylisticus convexus]
MIVKLKEMDLLSYSTEKLKKHCQLLDVEEKIILYEQLLDKAKDILKNSRDDVAELKKISKAAVAIEETTDQELLEKFNDDHPLREVDILIYSPQGNAKVTNYLFSIDNSSELCDLKEDKEKALYNAVKLNDVELVKKLLMILLPKEICNFDTKYLEELKILLSGIHKELQLSQDMKNYLVKTIKFYSFLCNNFSLLVASPTDVKAMIDLFAAQPNIDYQIDKLLLSFIVRDVEEKKLNSETSHMIELLEQHERFAELEYKVRRLRSEFASGKSRYSAEVIRNSIAEREKEMRGIEKKYIRPSDLINERQKLLKQFLC